MRNAPVTGEFPAQNASNAENDSIGWRHHAVNSIEEDIYAYLDDICLRDASQVIANTSLICFQIPTVSEMCLTIQTKQSSATQ